MNKRTAPDAPAANVSCEDHNGSQCAQSVVPTAAMPTDPEERQRYRQRRGSPHVREGAVHIDMPPRHPQSGSVQRLLEKEGHDARNVVSWLVPNRTASGGGGACASSVSGGTLPCTSGGMFDARLGGRASYRVAGQRGERGSRENSRERENGRCRRKSSMTSPFKGSNGSQLSRGTLSYRGRSNSDSTTHGFNQRLWGYLFRNVNRAVDELYYLCEAEGSATHCTEAADFLEGCGRDFSKLVERIADQKRFEEEQRVARAAERVGSGGEAGLTEASADSSGRKPKGLVWEVRKNTSSLSASPMVLNAIERMESQASSHGATSMGIRSRCLPAVSSIRAVAAAAAADAVDNAIAVSSSPPLMETSCDSNAVNADGFYSRTGRPHKGEPLSSERGDSNGDGRDEGESADSAAVPARLVDGQHHGSKPRRESVQTTHLAYSPTTSDVAITISFGSLDDSDIDAEVEGDEGNDHLGPNAVVTGKARPGRVTEAGGEEICKGTRDACVVEIEDVRGEIAVADQCADRETAAERRDNLASSGAVKHTTSGADRKATDNDATRGGMAAVRASDSEKVSRTDAAAAAHEEKMDSETTVTVSESGPKGPSFSGDKDDHKPGQSTTAVGNCTSEGSTEGCTIAQNVGSSREPLVSSAAKYHRGSAMTPPTKPGAGTYPRSSTLNPRAAPFAYNPGASDEKSDQSTASGADSAGGVTVATDPLPSTLTSPARVKASNVPSQKKVLVPGIRRDMERASGIVLSSQTVRSRTLKGIGETKRKGRKHRPVSRVASTCHGQGTATADAAPALESDGLAGCASSPDDDATTPASAVAACTALEGCKSGVESGSGSHARVDEERSPVPAQSAAQPATHAVAGKVSASADSCGCDDAGRNDKEVQDVVAFDKSKSEESVAPVSPRFLPPNSKWSRRPNLTPDGPGRQRCSSTRRLPRKQASPIPGNDASSPSRAESTTINDIAAGGTAAAAPRTPDSGKIEGRLKGNGISSGAASRAGSLEDRAKVSMSPRCARMDCTQRPGYGADGGGPSERWKDNLRSPAGDVPRADNNEPTTRRHCDADDWDAVAETGNECEDADSAYVNAMEKIWAEAEAWVDAEAKAEEEAWARLPTDLPCPSGSEGVLSDVEEPDALTGVDPGSEDVDPENNSMDGDVDDQSALEIEIPPPEDGEGEDDVPADMRNEGVEEYDIAGAHVVQEQLKKRELMRKLEAGIGDGARISRVKDTQESVDMDRHAPNSWSQENDPYAPVHGDEFKGRTKADTDGKLDRKSHERHLRVDGSQRGNEWPSPKSASSPLCRSSGGRSDGHNPPLSESSSGASYFGTERGMDTLDEGLGLFSHRELQKKLSSPQRKPQRKRLSADEAKRRQERRQMVAELNRAQLAIGMAEKLKRHEERARGVRFRKEEQLIKAEEEARKKMEGADARRQEHRRGIVRKANDANSKVEEVLFMNKLTVEDLKITLQMKLAEVDRRIQSGRARRQQLLAGISDRQRKRTKDKAAQMSERRLEAESAAATRWEALQKRLEAVQQRRRDREKETSRRMQAADRHSQARKRREDMMSRLAAEESQSVRRVQRGKRHPSADRAAVSAAREKLPDRITRITQLADESRDTAKVETNHGDVACSPKLDVQCSPPLPLRAEQKDLLDDSAAGQARYQPEEASSRVSAVDDGEHSLSVGGSSRSSTGVSTGDSEATCRSDPPVALPPSAAAGDSLELVSVKGQKRGRAQKKRVKKIRDKMRQLCLDIPVAPSKSVVNDDMSCQAPPKAGVGGGSNNDNRSGGESGVQRAGTRGPQAVRSAGESTHDDLPTASSSRLDTAVQDLMLLSAARLHHEHQRSRQQRQQQQQQQQSTVAEGVRPIDALRCEAGTGSDAKKSVVKQPAVVKGLCRQDDEQLVTTPTAARVTMINGIERSKETALCSESTTHIDERLLLSPSRKTSINPQNVMTLKVDEEGMSLANLAAKTSESSSGKMAQSVVPVRGDTVIPRGIVAGIAPASDAHTVQNLDSCAAVSPLIMKARDSAERRMKVADSPSNVPDAGAREGHSTNPTAHSLGEPASDVIHHRKTRRGKRAGGAVNRRRGAKEKTAGRVRQAAVSRAHEKAEAVTNVSAAVSAITPVRKVGSRPIREGAIPTEETDVQRGSGRMLPGAPAAAEAIMGSAQHSLPEPTANACITRDPKGAQNDEDTVHANVECKGKSGLGGGCEKGFCLVVVDKVTMPASGDGGDGMMRAGASISYDFTTLEVATLRSMQELRAMFFPGCESLTTNPTEKRRDRGRGYSPPVSGSAPASTVGGEGVCNAEARPHAQLRSRGVLEALVVLCAPFPWSPVPRGAAAAIPPVRVDKSVGRPVSSHVASRRTAVDPKGPSLSPETNVANANTQHTSVCATAAGADGRSAADESYVTPSSARVVQDISEPKVYGCGNDSGEAKEVVGRTDCDRGKGGHRGALTESALDVLLTAVADPGNRDCILSVDGGAPLVDCLARLLERATKDKDVANHSQTQSTSSSSSQKIDERRAEMACTSSNNGEKDPSSRDAHESNIGEERMATMGGAKRDSLSPNSTLSVAHTDATPLRGEERRQSTSLSGGCTSDVCGVGGNWASEDYCGSLSATCGEVDGPTRDVEEAMITALDVVCALIRHDPVNESCSRIQEELVRYFLAKRLLPDLAELIFQLHPSCERETSPLSDDVPLGLLQKSFHENDGRGTSSTRSHYSQEGVETKSIKTRGLSASPPLPVLRRKHLNPSSLAAPSSLGSSSRSPPLRALLLQELVGRVANLVDAVLSYPLRHTSGPRLMLPLTPLASIPLSTTIAERSGVRATASPRPCQTSTRSSRASRESNTFRDHGTLVSGGHRVRDEAAEGDGCSNNGCAIGGSGAAGRDAHGRGNIGIKEGNVESAEKEIKEDGRILTVCRRMDDLRDGSLAARPACARAITTGGGAARASVALLSLLAAMVYTEGRTGRTQRGEPGCASAKAQDEISSEDNSGTSARLSDGLLRLAGVVVQAANHACLLDLDAMQDLLSTERRQREFRFLCDRLLASLGDRGEAHDIEAACFERHLPQVCYLHTIPRILARTRVECSWLQTVAEPDTGPLETDEWLTNVVRLVGYFCLNNGQNQEVVRRGPPPSILVRLCDLPFWFFFEPKLRAVLFPTLISVCYPNVLNRDILENALAKELLAEFLLEIMEAYKGETEISGEVRNVRKTPSVHVGVHGVQADGYSAVEEQWQELSLRFPLDMWAPASVFFAPHAQKSRSDTR